MIKGGKKRKEEKLVKREGIINKHPSVPSHARTTCFQPTHLHAHTNSHIHIDTRVHTISLHTNVHIAKFSVRSHTHTCLNIDTPTVCTQVNVDTPLHPHSRISYDKLKPTRRLRLSQILLVLTHSHTYIDTIVHRDTLAREQARAHKH